MDGFLCIKISFEQKEWKCVSRFTLTMRSSWVNNIGSGFVTKLLKQSLDPWRFIRGGSKKVTKFKTYAYKPSTWLTADLMRSQHHPFEIWTTNKFDWQNINFQENISFLFARSGFFSRVSSDTSNILRSFLFGELSLLNFWKKK